MEYYKDIILESLEERINNEYKFSDGIVKKMVSPGMYRNETLSQLMDKIDENFIAFLQDIKRTQNLINPAVKENSI